MSLLVNIKDFGARTDSDFLQTECIQRAIDNVFLAGGGTVTIPEGTYNTGDIRIRSNVTLYLQENACLLGSRDPNEYFHFLDDTIEPIGEKDRTDCLWRFIYPGMLKNDSADFQNDTYDFLKIAGSRWNNALIRAIDAENIKIIGENNSFINGANCYDELGEEEYRGPHAISIFRCKNVSLRGYSIIKSANWAHNIQSSSNIVCEDIKVEAGHDGIHLTSCENAVIRHCRFYTGDDCVAGTVCSNVTVSDCELNSACSAFRFGGTNLLVERCNIFGPGKYLFRGSLSKEEQISGIEADDQSLSNHRRNMLSVFTYYSERHTLGDKPQGNIIMTDCVIKNADRFLHYNYSGNEPWQSGSPLESITFRNIKASNIRVPLNAYGDSEKKITLILNNVEITDSPDFNGGSLINACNYDLIMLNNIKISKINNCDAIIKKWSEGNIVLENINADIRSDSYVLLATNDFFTAPI